MKNSMIRLFCMLLCAVMLLGILPVTRAAADDKVGAVPGMKAITENEYGTVCFETVDDLKQLTAKTYSNWTYVHYKGTGDFVITEDLTLPAYMSLQVYGSDFSSGLVIAEGVTLTTAVNSFIQCDSMTVRGTLQLNDDMYFGKKLTVTGDIDARGNIGYWCESAVIGEEKIAFADGFTFHIQCEAYTLEELEDLLDTARANSRYYYETTLIVDSDLTIDVSLDFPANTSIYMGVPYMYTVTVAPDVTVTVRDYAQIECNSVIVQGKLVNKGRLDYIGYNLEFTSTGSYSGSGYLNIFERDGITSYTDVVKGLNTAKMKVSEHTEGYEHYWQLQNPASQKPAAPTLKVTVNTATGKPKLTWNKVKGAEKYRLYRATSKNGKYTLIKTTVTATSYTDTSAKAGKNYYYKVRALDTDTNTYSDYSNIVNRVCDLPKPVVSITRKSGDPKVTWKKVSGASKYRVYRATSKNGTYKLVKTTTKTGFTDTKVKAGKTYYYKVKAIHSKSSANSAYSSVKHIRAK